jgi:hypothetical protein
MAVTDRGFHDPPGPGGAHPSSHIRLYPDPLKIPPRCLFYPHGLVARTVLSFHLSKLYTGITWHVLLSGLCVRVRENEPPAWGALTRAGAGLRHARVTAVCACWPRVWCVWSSHKQEEVQLLRPTRDQHQRPQHQRLAARRLWQRPHAAPPVMHLPAVPSSVMPSRPSAAAVNAPLCPSSRVHVRVVYVRRPLFSSTAGS